MSRRRLQNQALSQCNSNKDIDVNNAHRNITNQNATTLHKVLAGDEAGNSLTANKSFTDSIHCSSLQRSHDKDVVGLLHFPFLEF